MTRRFLGLSFLVGMVRTNRLSLEFLGCSVQAFTGMWQNLDIDFGLALDKAFPRTNGGFQLYNYL